MTKKALSASVFVAIFLFLGAAVWAQSYTAAVMDLPSTPLYSALTLAIGEETGNKIDVQVVPTARAVALVENKRADMEIPQLVSHNAERLRTLPFDYSTEVIFDLAFVLYTNKAKPVDIANLKSGNSKGYVIETDLSNLASFEFKAAPSTNLEASLKKVSTGAIDGFIFSQTTSDLLLKKLGVTNIKRQLYDTFPLVFAIQKGARGGVVDQMLTAGLKKLRANGRYDKIIGAYAKTGKYVDWQL